MTAYLWLRAITCASCLATLPVMGATFGNFTYVDNGSDITITDCDASGNVVIPSQIDGKPVVSIASYAFLNQFSLTSVSIPDTVTRIEGDAFRMCLNLVSIEIPSSVTYLGSSVFSSCSGLTSVTLPEGLITIPQSTFRLCKNLSSVSIPTSVVTIGSSAFESCSMLQSITLPSGLKMIDTGAFQNCGLTSIELPKSLTNIGAGAFGNCNQIQSVLIPDSVTTIGSGSFYGCNSLANVVLPEGLLKLSDWTFGQCPLESIVIPASVEVIDDYCFALCKQLKKIVLPASLKRVGIETFFRCVSLTELRFSTSLRKLDERVFSQSGVLEVRFDGRAPAIEDETFDGSKKNLEVFFVDGQKGFTWPMWEGFPATPLGPEIQMAGHNGTAITTRVSTQNFGGRLIGFPRTKVFTIRNLGTRTLKKLAVELLANDGGDFVVTTNLRGASLEPGQSMRVKVTFRPTGAYQRRATLRIYSNDSNESPITMNLRGLGMW